jgi:hypothetical protein
MVWMKPQMTAAQSKRAQKRGSPFRPTNACGARASMTPTAERSVTHAELSLANISEMALGY